MSAPSLEAQATAVERAAVNLRGHINNLREAVQRGKRGADELRIAELFLADLEPAAATMRGLANRAKRGSAP